VYLDPEEFHTTWCAMESAHARSPITNENVTPTTLISALDRLGNKAIYRTRMAMATGGELIVLAPGKKCRTAAHSAAFMYANDVSQRVMRKCRQRSGGKVR
jgi:hypothetical protein